MEIKNIHKYIWLELAIWLFIVFFAVGVVKIWNYHSHKQLETYQIFMPDVDGLIVGSPVRAMGIEIGHVTDIQPLKDEVYVKFMLTDKSVKLPQGTAATVEFNGMGGSKSLELYLPDKDTYVDSTVPTLTVHPPRRLSDSVGLLNEMFKNVGNIIAVSSKFGSKLSKIDFPNGNMGDPHEFLKFADEMIDIQQKRVDDFGEKLNELGRKFDGRKLQQ